MNRPTLHVPPSLLQQLHRARSQFGLTLVELVVVVAVLGVLLSIALPSYREYKIRANRSAAQAVLLEIVSREEQYAASNRAYFATPAANDLGGLGMTLPDDVSANYDITVALSNVLGTNDGFVATATAKGEQTGDGDLAVNQFGLRTPTGKW
jgi:type IV pilus assembly protein PilE